MILALDVSLCATGWVVFRPPAVPFAAGCIRTEASSKKRGIRVADDDAERCAELYRGLREVVRCGEYGILAAVAELPSGGGQGARAVTAMALSRGAVTVALESFGLGYEIVTPQAVKKAATGGMSATKEQMIARAGAQFGLNSLQAAWERSGGKVGLPIPAWALEHVCDAAWAFMAARNGSLVRTVFATHAPSATPV